MQADRASRTAGYVAALRGLGPFLPTAARLIDDPWGARWTGTDRLRAAAELAPFLGVFARPAWRELLVMQVRTRVLDDAVRAFAQRGGRQLVLFGAGFDARALRLRDLGLRVFEVDHPATQAAKRSLVEGASTLVPWDFERDPLPQLPDRLASLGYARDAIGCVIWEGVTMYLSVEAIEASVAMLRTLLTPGSTLGLTYFGTERLERPTLGARVVQRFIARRGEPWRFGWDPPELPAWLAQRGFRLERDEDISVHARELLPAPYAKRVTLQHRRIAITQRA